MASENRGNLRKNKNKTQPNQPDYRGKCVIDGKEFWISSWKKEKDGDQWLSMEFELKQTEEANSF